ncbi:hypothetical protein [Spirosoma luteolum]
MRSKVLAIAFLLLSVSVYAQTAVMIGVKAALTRFSEDDFSNRVGGFAVDAYNRGTKPMAQLYGRFQYGRLYVQPELRYSQARFFVTYQNIDRENPLWSYYSGIGSQSLAADMYRLDVPLKVGYFLFPRLSVNAGVINTFYSYKDRSYSFMDNGRFLIGDDVFDSHKKYVLSGIMGVNYHANRLVIEINYDFPFGTMHNPVNFSGSSYEFKRKTHLLTFSVGYDIVRFKSKK